MEKKMKPNFFEKTCMQIVNRQLKNIEKGLLTVVLPNKEKYTYGDTSSNHVQYIYIHNYQFFTKLVFAGNIGLGESYTNCDWDTPDLPNLLSLFIYNMNKLKKSGLTDAWIKRIIYQISHMINRNTKAGSRRNIHAHYDLGNDFYKVFLDSETLLYSSAIFENQMQSLGDAQHKKIRNLIKLANINSSHHILEVGCGWGGFAIEAAKITGCKVTGITISQAQYELAKERVQKENLSEKIDIKLCDYRDVTGCYDRIISIEMLEAVGHAYYGTYFSNLDRLLKPGGCIAIQVITIPDQRYGTYRRNPDWIQKHIFPGGILPSLTELSKSMSKNSLLNIHHIESIGPHYAETLRRWRSSFEKNSKKIEDMGYNLTFQRKWKYYLSYCEAGFQTEYTNNLQLMLKRPTEQLI